GGDSSVGLWPRVRRSDLKKGAVTSTPPEGQMPTDEVKCLVDRLAAHILSSVRHLTYPEGTEWTHLPTKRGPGNGDHRAAHRRRPLHLHHENWRVCRGHCPRAQALTRARASGATSRVRQARIAHRA